jgi:hypothetical protein
VSVAASWTVPVISGHPELWYNIAHRHHRPATIQLNYLARNPTYPANLCPLFLCAEFACYGEDLGETVGDALKTAARSAVWQGAPEHLEQVLSGQQRVHYSFQAGAGRGDLYFRLRGEMAGSDRAA